MSKNPALEFYIWLSDRAATKNRELAICSDHIRPLLKTERTECEVILGNFRRIFENQVE